MADEIIISLTSYPARIATVHLCIETLLSQSYKADKIVLWLAKDQFPNLEADLPKELVAQTQRELTLKWIEKDLKSYTKLIPSLKEYPKALIATADDDILYPNNWLYNLVNAYHKNPNQLNALRCHRINFKGKNVLPYRLWRHSIGFNKATYLNFSTGVGGIIYHKNLLHTDLFKEDLFMKLAPKADDLWFWAMAVLNNTKINWVKEGSFSLEGREIPGSQTTALWYTNNDTGNDQQLIAIMQHYPHLLTMLNQDKKTVWFALLKIALKNLLKSITPKRFIKIS